MPQQFLNEEWVTMRRRIVDRITQRQSDMVSHVVEIPIGTYTDPRRFEQEKSVLFTQTPLLAGFSGELSEPGSVMLFDGAGPGVFITRREDGSLGAWLNMCTHRGARLLRDCQNRTAFSCPFHAWRFDNYGKLIGRPLAECFDGANASVDLAEVPVAEKYGMIFIKAMPSDDGIDIDKFLGPIASLIQSFELEGAIPIGKDSYRTETNWKIALETGCEGYHVPAAHAKTLAPQMVPFLTIHDSFGIHHRYCGPTRDHIQCVGKPESEWPESSYGAAHFIYPNVVFSYTSAINGSNPVLALLRLFPGNTPGETLVVHNLYKPKNLRDQDDAPFVELHNMIIGINQNEDLVIARDVWRNYVGFSPEHLIVLGRNEMVLQKLHHQIAQGIGMPLAGCEEVLAR